MSWTNPILRLSQSRRSWSPSLGRHAASSPSAESIARSTLCLRARTPGCKGAAAPEHLEQLEHTHPNWSPAPPDTSSTAAPSCAQPDPESPNPEVARRKTQTPPGSRITTCLVDIRQISCPSTVSVWAPPSFAPSRPRHGASGMADALSTSPSPRQSRTGAIAASLSPSPTSLDKPMNLVMFIPVRVHAPPPRATRPDR
jgi:hypothetical protein